MTLIINCTYFDGHFKFVCTIGFYCMWNFGATKDIFGFVRIFSNAFTKSTSNARNLF